MCATQIINNLSFLGCIVQLFLCTEIRLKTCIGSAVAVVRVH